MKRSLQPDYQQWVLENHPSDSALEAFAAASRQWPSRPLVSVLVPVFNTPHAFLEAMLASVAAQTYDCWELCLVDDGSSDPGVARILERWQAGDARVRVSRHPEQRGIVPATNTALAMARGEFVAMLDHDDALAPHALHCVVETALRHPDAAMIYTDEDKIDEAGVRSGPFFKPDWCPDSFLSRMYPAHLNVYRASLLRELGGLRAEYEGGQHYDLVLRLSERTEAIYHVPDVLYHWRMHSGSTARDAWQKPYVYDADRRALQDSLDRRGEGGVATPVEGPVPGYYSVRYPRAEHVPVDVIIPSRDHGAMLDRCLESVFAKSTYRNFKVTLVDNGTVESEALSVFAKWQEREPLRFTVLPADIPFNFSTLCNLAVERTEAPLLLFLNNDTEVITPDWIEGLAEYALRPTIGAAGALLFYEDGTVQHAGAILGLGGLAAHSHRGAPGDSPGYAGQIATINNYLSVAGTCLMTRRELFVKHGRFDEQLPGDWEDVDYNLKLVDAGYRNVYLPHVKLFHAESKTRGRDYFIKDHVQQKASKELMLSRWRKYVDHDPCYNPNLTRVHEDFRIRLKDEAKRRTWVVRPAAAWLRASHRLRELWVRRQGVRCHLDEVQVVDGRMLFVQGWAFGLTGAIAGLDVELGGKRLAHLKPALPRPDVAGVYPGQENVGFCFFQECELTVVPRLDLTLSCVRGDGRRTRFRYAVHAQDP